MIGAGTVINPLIKIITTVVILGAVYLFIVKPALDTTNNAFDQFGGISDDIQGQIDDALSSSSNAGRLQDCIDRAINGTDVQQEAVQRCINRFTD